MDIEKQIIQEYKIWHSQLPDHMEPLNTSSGSNRMYYRLKSGDQLVIATYNKDIRENEAFFYLNRFFRSREIKIPELYHVSADKCIYFQQDVGDVCLLDKLKNEGLSQEVKGLYHKSLLMVLKMQTSAYGLDFNKCYPRPSFDTQSILWDLNYFKYYFLKVSGIEFDEQLLENDFHQLAKTIAAKNDEPYFMFRDFQARNIQIFNGEPWFIDFQGGRRGPLAYDVASLLFQASANLPQDFRNELLDYYFFQVPEYHKNSRKNFDKEFNRILLIRIIQVLGAYGFRGLIEGKTYFKNSIPNALDNLHDLLFQIDEELDIQYLLKILHGLIQIKNNFVD